MRQRYWEIQCHVEELMRSLRARGESSDDLLANLFKGYGACADKVFVEYIGRKMEEWDENAIQLTPESLMQRAMDKYKLLKTKELWEAPSPEEEKLIALEAKITKVKFAKYLPKTI